MFGRETITLGIGPHSSYYHYSVIGRPFVCYRSVVCPVLSCLSVMLKKKEETTGQKYNGLPYYIGWP